MSSTRIFVQIFALLLLTGGAALFVKQRDSTSPSPQPLQASRMASKLPAESGSEKYPGMGELIVFDAERSWKGFTLYPVSGTAEVLLLNHAGRVVHSWNVDADRARLLENGNLLVLHGSKWGLSQKRWRSLRSTIREYDWNGEIVWEKKAQLPAHHDIQRLENGHTLFLERAYVPKNIRAKISDRARAKQRIRSDRIVELDKRGAEVWDWFAHDHIDPATCGKHPCKQPEESFGAGGHALDWTHMNALTILPENRWYESGDRRFKPGNILTTARNHSRIYLIDKESKEVVWRYSGDYKGGISGGHEPAMIPKGFPGAGNILVFDNGREEHSDESFVLEIEPPTKKVVWVYDPSTPFHSEIAGSQQRLPNGNTLISEDDNGNIFEVDKDGNIVWQYKGRYRTSRSHRYSPDYTDYFSSLALR